MLLTEAIGRVRPKALKKGGTIGLTAPSSQINIKMVSNFARYVEDMGFTVVLGETITYMTDKDYNAGSPKTRAHDFNRMIEDPKIDVVWAAGGGFGAQTTVPYLDFRAIANNPKPIIGFSDTTFLLNAIQKEVGLVSFLGPTGEIAGEQDHPCINYALNMLMNQVEYPFLIQNFDGVFIRSISYADKQVVGKIIGGNLTMMQTTVGTDWQPDTQGKILLLEEVGESSYTIERTLSHMKSAGMFDDPAAVVFGEFSRVKREGLDDAHDSNPSVNEILVKMFADAKYPVLTGYNFSHGNHNLTIPIGGIGKVDGAKRTLEILESPVL